jgi:homoserine dehydrogenase
MLEADAARKMTILATLGFSMKIDLADVSVRNHVHNGRSIQYETAGLLDEADWVLNRMMIRLRLVWSQPSCLIHIHWHLFM